MRQLLHFWGMKRSGNHAILPWIKENVSIHGVNTSHFNSIFEHSEYLAEMPRVLSEHKDYVTTCSYEDCNLSYAMLSMTVIKEGEIMPNSVYRHMLLLRDPFNTFASRMKRMANLTQEGKTNGWVQRTSWPVVVKLWKQYALEYLGVTDFLPKDKITVNYNSWVSERKYRDELLLKIGYENKDLCKEQVSNAGDGSSFDFRSRDGMASSMEVFDRWKYYEKNETYRLLFQDPELIKLSEEIFGHIPGTEVLFK